MRWVALLAALVLTVGCSGSKWKPCEHLEIATRNSAGKPQWLRYENARYRVLNTSGNAVTRNQRDRSFLITRAASPRVRPVARAPELGPDEVIEKPEAKEPTGLAQRFGQLPVFGARFEISRGMMVREDHRVGPEQYRGLQNQERFDRCHHVGADRNDSPTERAVLGVEIDRHGLLTGGVTHRSSEEAAPGRLRPGDCLVFVAGQPPVYGQQIVYFADAVLGARGAIQAPSKRDAAPRRSLSPDEKRMAKELL